MVAREYRYFNSIYRMMIQMIKKKISRLSCVKKHMNFTMNHKVYIFVLMLTLPFYKTGADIASSGHDLTSLNVSVWSSVCQNCHLPMSVDSDGLYPEIDTTQLWDTNLISEISASVNLTMYGGDTASILDSRSSQRGAITKFCMSCHDGFYFSEYMGSTLPGSSDHGTAKTDVIYNSQTASQNRNLYDPINSTTILGGTIAEEMLAGYPEKKFLTCISCHDVHLSTNNALRIDNDSQGLCLTCHISLP